MKKILLLCILGCVNASCQNKSKMEVVIEDDKLQLPADPSFVVPIYIVNNDYGIFQESQNIRKIFKVDSKSFRFPKYDSSQLFALDKNGIYFKGERIATDTTGFRIIGGVRSVDVQNTTINPENGVDYFWKTATKLYRNTTEIKNNIDVASFTRAVSFESSYFKDKNYIYYMDERIEKSDPLSVTETNTEIIFDKNYVYVKGKIGLYQGDTLRPVNKFLMKTSNLVLTVKDFNVIDGIDAKTLKPLSRFFSRDKNSVYFYKHKIPVQATRLKNIKVWDQTNSAYLSDGVTLYSVYSDGSFKPMTELDAKTFGMFPISDYYYDKNGVYGWIWLEKESKGVIKKFPFNYTEPVSSLNVSMTERHNGYVFYKNQASDGITLYKNLTDEEIQLIRTHKKSLVQMGLMNNSYELTTVYDYKLYQANNTVFWNEKKTDADAATFERVKGNYNYYKDKNYVYQYSREKGLIRCEGVDAETVTTFNVFLTDKEYLYAKNYRILKNKNVELLGVFQGYIPGCGLDRTPSSSYYLLKNTEGYWILCISDTVKIKNIGFKLDENLKKFDVE